MNQKTQHIAISDIRLDGDTQSRVGAVDENVVAQYAEAMQNGATFPPVVLFHDDGGYWVGSGWHRIAAYDEVGTINIPAEVRSGGMRDAKLFAMGTNSKHGRPRTNADKRKNVNDLLNDKEWSSKSNCWMAKACDVAESFIRKIKKERGISTSHSAKCQDGRVMNTGNIGRTHDPDPKPSTEPVKPLCVQPNAPIVDRDEPEPNRGSVPVAPAAPVVDVSPGANRTPQSKIYAELAIRQLRQIPEADPDRQEAINMVMQWCIDNSAPVENVNGKG